MEEKKPCPSCDSPELRRDSSINYVEGMGYVSNSYEYCEKCGHTETFGPRW